MRLLAPLLALALLLSAPADAGTLEGVTLPDTASVGGQNLVLNGMGLREKYTLDVYVAGLYLPSKTASSSTAINQDAPKRLVMVMVMGVDKAKLAESIQEGIAGRSLSAEAKAGIDKIASWMETVAAGDKIVLDYAPGTGTTVSIKGKVKGTVPGSATMKALWGIYLGDPPVTTALRDGLLGK